MPNIAPAGQNGAEADAETPLLRLDAAVRAFAARGATRFWAIRLAVILALDALIMLGSFVLSRLILSDLPMPRTLLDPWFMALFVGVNLSVLFVVGTYRQSWRFLSIGDALSLAASLLASSWLIWMITAGLLAPHTLMSGPMTVFLTVDVPLTVAALLAVRVLRRQFFRSEEHTSELQSLMRISYAVFCLKKKKQET